ncbi:hypothetical protein [Oribacterium sp. WCC10]|uniref:hypothetical protein n=1 Tax=Oribacterium sp. WCC10 TaxID=1855343 RepID=UPI0008EB5B9C|nr:hypothetical protein [Oribacterium sp. WCC10]SFG63721.1 hypothetical protein SAMN05216356_11637 [Oribacterium sp. WCC10]
MKQYKLKNGTYIVEAVPMSMGSIEGYGVRYTPNGNIVWCERNGFELDYEPVNK